MVKAIIDIKKETNRVLNVIKARHGYRTKSEAIDHLAKMHPEARVSKRREPIQVEHDLKKHREMYG